LKRLAMLHGKWEIEVDNLLRRHRLVDLYKVVREAVRISEPGYSIENVEAFYLDGARSGTVTTAGDSITIYERFRRLGAKALLDEIEAYNKLDCQSLFKCRDWLVALRPADMLWPAAALAAEDLIWQAPGPTMEVRPAKLRYSWWLDHAPI
jgi:uncharacterized protein